MTESYLKQELYDLVRTDPAIFDFLQAGSLDGIWYWDLNNPEQEWMSPQFWELFGIDPTTKQHLAAEWQGIIFPEDLVLALDNFEKHCADPDHPYDHVVRYRHADGSTVWVRCRGIAIRDADGKPLRMLGAHHDITEQMLTKEQLLRETRETIEKEKAGKQVAERIVQQKVKEIIKLNAEMHKEAERLKAILNEINASVLVIRPSGKIAFANKVATEQFGYEDEALNDEHIDALLPRDALDIEKVLRAGTDDGQPPRMTSAKTFIGWRKDGRRIPLEIGLATIRQAGETRVLLTAIEISQRLEAEKEVRVTLDLLITQNEELTHLSRLIAHDLMLPISRLDSLAHLLEESQDAGHDDKVRDYARQMRNTTKRTVQMITAMQDYASIGTEMDAVPVAVGPVIQQAHDNLEDTIAAKKAVVHIDVDTVTAMGSESLLLQLFQNVIGHALENASEQNPEVWVTKITDMPEVRFRIDDNGPGIPPIQQEAIFEPFGGKRLGDVDGAPGLDLATCRKIVALHEGRIWCTSNDNAGTSFHITLPVAVG